MKTVRIIGSAKELPGPPMTNEDVLKTTKLPKDITVEWMNERIGILPSKALQLNY
jgi:3-oxoacyl-[acyl-carrier-protein] synthase III